MPTEYYYENWIAVFTDDAGFIGNSYTGFFANWHGEMPKAICTMLPEVLHDMLKEDRRC